MTIYIMSSISFFISFVVNILLKLRYRVESNSLQKVLNGHEPKGLLILPNHPSYSDPVIVFSQLWSQLRPRPLSWEGNWKNPLMIPFLELANAIPIPDLTRPSVDARERMKVALLQITQGLQIGQNQILWPSGKIQRDGVDRLGGNSGVEAITLKAPETKLLLVRTEGLWGSRFGYGFTGNAPSFTKQSFIVLGWLMGSFLFFMPKRYLKMHFRLVTPNEYSALDRNGLNRLIEEFYGGTKPPEPVLIPYHPFLPTLPNLGELEFQNEDYDTKTFQQGVVDEVNQTLEEKLLRKLTPDETVPKQKLGDLGIDSLDLAEVTLHVEQRFGFHADEVPQTLGALWALAHGTGPKPRIKPAPFGWKQKAGSNRIATMQGNTLPEALVHSCLKHTTRPALADDLSGMISFQRLLIGAWALSEEICKLPEKRIGVMLPASVGNDVVLFACFLAGKVPVLLNWTTGPTITAQCALKTGVVRFLTSKRFMDRIGIEIPGLEPVFLEEIRSKLKKSTLLYLLFRAKITPRWFLDNLPKIDPNQPAVILFTSGSEKAPKAVPLTHNNLLSNQRAGTAHLQFLESEIFLGFLPAFHSFGLVITFLFPLSLGIRVVHHPDPTDSSALAKKIRNYRVTVLLGTPTFLGMILDRSSEGDLATLRFAVCGAEKLQSSLSEEFRKKVPQMEILEGYGITECGPVVSANPPGAAIPGSLGILLPGTKAEIIDLETNETVLSGERGMLLVSSSAVFPGYEGAEEDPFVERNGAIWYRTGDLCRQDEKGYLYFEGRLKRFIKIAGEMVSLPALEDSFIRRFPKPEEGPAAAVEGTDENGKRWIVLFSTQQIRLQEANKILMEDGFRGIYRLDQVVIVGQIPILGSGKTDYKQLRAQSISLAPA